MRIEMIISNNRAVAGSSRLRAFSPCSISLGWHHATTAATATYATKRNVSALEELCIE